MTQLLKKSMTFATLAATGIAAALFATPSFAAAPMVKTPAPGYFRMMLGDFEVTAISDGTVDLPVNTLLKGIKPAAVDKALAKSWLTSPLETSVNGYLINTGGKLILIDAGAGGLFGPTLGKFLANLKASGYQPEQIDEVYLTHLHADHVGGLTVDGKALFPNATVRAEKSESDFWLSKTNLEQADAASKGFFQGAMSSMQPYVAAGKYLPFEGNVELVPGIMTHAANGHTPGHVTYAIESRGQKLVLIGDLIHVAAVQLEQPAVTIGFDSDAKAAGAERKLAFDAAAKGGYLLGAAHVQFPGLGHVRAAGKGYQWVPVNYTQMR
jgi:glyoxylase-like metal-dependent hydrolase (beta-lactamase superfamily II)